MATPQRLPIVNSDDGTWGDILRQYLMKEHYNDDTDNSVNGGHQKITVRAGTSSAGTAPLKFTSGTLLSSPEAGAMEFNTDSLYFTQTTSATRKKVAIYNDASGATGDIYYRDSSGYFVRLAIGVSDGKVLTVASGLPAWQDPTGSLGGSTGATDNAVLRADGTGGSTLQSSGVIIDDNDNVTADNFIANTSSTATAAGTTTLTINSTQVQIFTGSTTQNVNLPTTSVVAGQSYSIVNQSSGAVTVRSSGANNILVLAASTTGVFTAVVNTPTTAAHWVGSALLADKTLTVNNDLTFAGTDATTITFPTTSATIARTDAANTFTGASTASAWVLTSPTITTGIVPTSNDGAALGSTSNNFSDLFLATGAVIHYNNGNVVMTHSSGILTMGTGELRVTTAGTNTASVITQGSTNTITSKTINLANNTLTGTTSEFNTALSDGNFAVLDANNNFSADTFIKGTTSSATAAGTTTLDINSTQVQIFTGSTTQNVDLPTTSVVAGQTYTVVNQSSGIVTVRSSGGNNISALAGSTTGVFIANTTTPTTAAHWVATGAGVTETLTNKRITSRVTSITSSATPTVNTDNCDSVDITALATNITSMTTNLSGTPSNFDKLMIRIKDDGTARTITWGASFQSSGIATLPVTTVVSKVHHIALIYHTSISKWVCIAVDGAGY